MNMTRILILVGALAAAGLAAFLARGLMGGQHNASASPNVDMTEVAVASKAIDVGSKIQPGDLKWQQWPKTAVDPSFITKDAQPQALEEAEKGSVARMPLVNGEPVTAQKVIQTDGAGFMAAVLTPGMRAVGVKLSAERGAGGFILPNDRVDVVMTRKLANDENGIPSYQAATVLRDVRVLAVDQTSQEEGDAKSIVGKTATVEVSAQQAEILALAEAMGDLSLSLRSLSQSDKPTDTDEKAALGGEGNQISILRFGIPGHSASSSSSEQ